MNLSTLEVMFWAFWPILGLVTWMVVLGMAGVLSPQSIGMALVCAVMFLAMIRVFGGALNRDWLFAFRVILPIGAFLTAIALRDNQGLTHPETVGVGLFTVVSILFALYFTVHRSDFARTVSIAAVLVSFALDGSFLYAAVLLILAFAVSQILIRRAGVGGRHIWRFCFTVFIPVVSFIKLALFISDGSLQSFSAVFTSLAAITIMLFGIFIMIFGAVWSMRRE